MNIHVISNILVRILTISIVALACCISVAIYFHEPVKPFLNSIFIISFIAFALFAVSRKKDVDIERKEAFLSVSLAWFIISLTGTLPYIISGTIPSFADAFFESTAGFTSTGSTILTDIESLPKSILFWRSITQSIGGIGIIMLVIVIMPSLKMGNYSLFSMESSLQERVTPRAKELAVKLFAIYVILNVLSTILLYCGGMGLFDSVCHAMGTVATGGFSSKNTSITEFSAYIQYVILAFMFLGGTNFIIFYFIGHGNFKKIRENEELKYYLGFILVAGAFITGILYFGHVYPLEASFRHAFFQVISIMTTTGYATTDYMLWPKAGWILLFFLLFSGGCTGSTSGGIKVGRHVILFKNIRYTLQSYIHPNSVKKIKLNTKTITPEDNNTIVSFVTIYFVFFIIGSILMVIMGLDIQTATGSIGAAIGGVGLGIGMIGPSGNFQHLPDMAKYLLSFFMLLGRLEIYTLLILFVPSFWKKI